MFRSFFHQHFIHSFASKSYRHSSFFSWLTRIFIWLLPLSRRYFSTQFPFRCTGFSRCWGSEESRMTTSKRGNMNLVPWQSYSTTNRPNTTNWLGSTINRIIKQMFIFVTVISKIKGGELVLEFYPPVKMMLSDLANLICILTLNLTLELTNKKLLWQISVIQPYFGHPTSFFPMVVLFNNVVSWKPFSLILVVLQHFSS